MPNSALSRAATRAWGTPSTAKAADRERGDVEGRAEQADAGRSRARPGRRRRASSSSWSAIGVPADGRELVDGGVERDGADHVRRAGLLPLGRLGPDHLVEVDEVDRPAAGEERVAVGEGAPGPDEHAGAERGVHLVAAPGQEVGGGGHRAVGGELGGVDEHRDARGRGRRR